MKTKISLIITTLLLSQSAFSFDDPYADLLEDGKKKKPLLKVEKDELAFQKSLVKTHVKKLKRDVYYITEAEAKKNYELTEKVKTWEQDLLLNEFFFSEEELNNVRTHLRYKYLTEFSYKNSSIDKLSEEISKYSKIISEHYLEEEYQKEKVNHTQYLRDRIKEHKEEIVNLEKRKQGFRNDASEYLSKGFEIEKKAEKAQSAIDNSANKIFFKIDDYLTNVNEKSKIKLSDLNNVKVSEKMCDKDGYNNSNKRKISYSIQINDVLCVEHTFFRKLSEKASNALMSTNGFEKLLDTHSYILARNMQILGNWNLRKQSVQYINLKDEIKKLKDENKDELRLLAEKYGGNYETLTREIRKYKDWIADIELKIKRENTRFENMKSKTYVNIANRSFNQKTELKNAFQNALKSERELLFFNNHKTIEDGKYKHIIVKKNKPIVLVIDSGIDDRFKESYILNMKWAELSKPHTSSNKFKAIAINKLKYAAIGLANIKERNLGHDAYNKENKDIITNLLHEDISDSYLMIDKIKYLDEKTIVDYYK